MRQPDKAVRPRETHDHELFEDAIVPEKTLARFHAEGTAWAYELAEAVVLNCRTYGLLNFHIPMGFARAWQTTILRWPENVVTEVRAWRATALPPNVKVPTPHVVMELVEQARAYILGTSTVACV